MNQYKPHMHHRRSIRLKGYDYSQAGLYFITICTHDRACLLGEIVDGTKNMMPNQWYNHSPQHSTPVMILNDAGKIAEECWLEIPKHFPNVTLHEHVIMPNHIHGIIELTTVGAKNFSPTNGIPTDFSPTNGIPTDFSPTNGTPTDFSPTNDIPTHILPTNGTPTDFSSTNGIPTDFSSTNGTPTNISPTNGISNHDIHRANIDSSNDYKKRANIDEPNDDKNGVNIDGPNDDKKRANIDEPNDDKKRANIDEPNDDKNGANIDSPLRSPSLTIGSIVRGFKIGLTKWCRQNTNVKIVWQRNYYEHIIRDEQSYQRISNYIVANPQKWMNDSFHPSINSKK